MGAGRKGVQFREVISVGKEWGEGKGGRLEWGGCREEMGVREEVGSRKGGVDEGLGV